MIFLPGIDVQYQIGHYKNIYKISKNLTINDAFLAIFKNHFSDHSSLENVLGLIQTKTQFNCEGKTTPITQHLTEKLENCKSFEILFPPSKSIF